MMFGIDFWRVVSFSMMMMMIMKMVMKMVVKKMRVSSVGSTV